VAPPIIRSVCISATASFNSSILSAMQKADDLMVSAANSIASDDLDGYVDASVSMTMAKFNIGIAAKLTRAQDEMMKSTLDILA
jgi:hypothetical protein